MRGGTVVLKNIGMDRVNFTNNNLNVLDSFREALQMEQMVYKSLMELHKKADECNDYQFSDYLESNYLGEQLEAVNMLRKCVTELEMIGDNGHGVWDYNKNFKEM